VEIKINENTMAKKTKGEMIATVSRRIGERPWRSSTKSTSLALEKY